MTGIITIIVRKALNRAAALRKKASNPDLDTGVRDDLIKEAMRLEDLAAAAEGGDYEAIKAICEELTLTAEWHAYLLETGRSIYASEHQLRPKLPDDDEDGSGGGMTGGPR